MGTNSLSRNVKRMERVFVFAARISVLIALTSFCLILIQAHEVKIANEEKKANSNKHKKKILEPKTKVIHL